MTKEETDKLPYGLYLIHWKSGGASLAAVGGKYNGDKWICCSNWTSSMDKGTDGYGEEIWECVEKVGLIATT